MKNLKKNLNAVSKEIKALQKKVDKLLVVVGKIEKPKVAKKSKTNVVKKNPVKKTVATKVVVNKPTARKSTKTAVDTILGVIKRSKKGVYLKA